MHKDTSSAVDGRVFAARFIGRIATGVVLGCFGFWELTGPGQWTGFVPSVLRAVGPAVLLVLAHGWLLFMLGVAALIDFASPVVSWIAVAVMAEVVLGLVLTSGLTSILVRDLGLLALALIWALECGAARHPAVSARTPLR